MRSIVFATLLAVLALSDSIRAQNQPPVVTRKSPIRIWVDQIGYSTADPKLAIVASDVPLPDNLDIALLSDTTSEPVWTETSSTLTKFNDGRKDNESGEYLAHLDFSAFRTPGRYYFLLKGDAAVRSYRFNIDVHALRDAGLAAWKAYYFSQADGELTAKYAGPWSHGRAFLGPDQATEARVFKWHPGNRWPDQIGTEPVGSQTYDVHGGWFDAGDFNKYTSNSVDVHNQLLMAYEMSKRSPADNDGPRDNELNIPESGNGIPDVLDEIRCETEFLIRDNDGTGAAFGRVHLEPGSPPESVTKPVQLTMPNSEVTMARAAALAYAAAVWSEAGFDPAFARLCQTEALKSWDLLQRKPHPWPVDPKNPKKILSQGEMRDDHQFANWQLAAAAALFRLTHKPEYEQIVRQNLEHRNWGGGEPAEPGLWIYMNTKGADPALVGRIRSAVFNYADNLVSQSHERGYAVGMQGYWWGSNRLAGKNAGALVLASILTDHPATKPVYLHAAEEFIHYMNGRNPLGLCYFTNMKSLGAENSVTTLFHSWVGNVNSPAGQKYIGDGPGKIGPFPGYVIGGPNGNMKRLVEDLDWRKAPWEFTEPDIGYQSEVLRGYGPFIWPHGK